MAETHDYKPDLMAMGDCAVCGRPYDDPVHAGPLTSAMQWQKKLPSKTCVITTPSVGEEWFRERFERKD